MGIKEDNYEWTTTFHIIDLGQEGDDRTCPQITAGKDWQFKCMSHSNLKNITCTSIDYCAHTLDTSIPFLCNLSYFSDRENIIDHSALLFPKMMRYLYRMLAHIYYHHRKQFDSL
jgi:hypothetical protein